MRGEGGDPFDITRAILAALAVVLFVVSIHQQLPTPAIISLLCIFLLRYLE